MSRCAHPLACARWKVDFVSIARLAAVKLLQVSLGGENLVRRILYILVLCLCAGCAEQNAHRAQRMEPTLSQAGFTMVPANTPARADKLQTLRPLKVTYFTHDGKPVYWFADPYVCHCLFRGTQANYDSYQQLRQDAAAQERAEAIDDYQTQQAYIDYMGSASGQVFYGQ